MIRSTEDPGGFNVTLENLPTLERILETQDGMFLGFVAIDYFGTPYYVGMNAGVGWGASEFGIEGSKSLSNSGMCYPVTVIWREKNNDKQGWNKWLDGSASQS